MPPKIHPTRKVFLTVFAFQDISQKEIYSLSRLGKKKSTVKIYAFFFVCFVFDLNLSMKNCSK